MGCPKESWELAEKSHFQPRSTSKPPELHIPFPTHQKLALKNPVYVDNMERVHIPIKIIQDSNSTKSVDQLIPAEGPH